MSEISQPILTPYCVTITATVTKTYRIEAENLESAIENAHEIFNLLPDDADEHYDQQVVNAFEVIYE